MRAGAEYPHKKICKRGAARRMKGRDGGLIHHDVMGVQSLFLPQDGLIGGLELQELRPPEIDLGDLFVDRADAGPEVQAWVGCGVDHGAYGAHHSVPMSTPFQRMVWINARHS